MAHQPRDDDDDDEVAEELEEQNPDPLNQFLAVQHGQATVSFGDIDKGHEIRGVPRQLDGVVDDAVDLIIRVLRREVDADLDDLCEHIEVDLNLRRSSDTLPLEDSGPNGPFAILERLFSGVFYYYQFELDGYIREEEANNQIFSILNQYCMKVKDIIRGCLVADLQLKDDHQLSHLVSNLNLISRQIREALFKKVKISSLVEMKDIPNDVKEGVKKLFDKMLDKLKLCVVLQKQEMMNFLKHTEKIVRLTILIQDVLLQPPKPKSVAHFLKDFKSFEHTYKELRNLLGSPREKSGEKYSEDPSKVAEDLKALTLDTEKDVEGASGKDLGESFEESPSMTGTKRKVYKGLLSPPGVKAEQAVDPELSQTALYLPSLPDSVTDRELFDFFKQFGPLVDVVLPWDSYTGRKRGFGRVQFAKMEDAKRALDSKHSSGSFSEIKQSEKRYESKLEKEKLYIRVESPETQSLVQTICGPDSLHSLRAASAYFPLLFVPMTSPESALKALERLQAEGVYVLFARERQAGPRGQRRF